MKMEEIFLAKCRLDDSDSIHPEGAFASFIFRQQTSFYPKKITTSHDVGQLNRGNSPLGPNLGSMVSNGWYVSGLFQPNILHLFISIGGNFPLVPTIDPNFRPTDILVPCLEN